MSVKEDIMYIFTIPAYMVYDGFNQKISVALVYKRLQDIQHNSPTRDHALALLHSCMVEIWINIYTKPLSPHDKFYIIIPPQDRMCTQWRSKQLLTTIALAANTEISSSVTQPPPQGSLNKPIQGGGSGGGYNTNMFHLDETVLQAVLKQVAYK